MDSERAAFISAICERPDDDFPRLLYAEWLDERREHDRAEFIRCQCELETLRKQPGWLPTEYEMVKAGSAESLQTLFRLNNHNRESKIESLRRRQQDLLPSVGPDIERIAPLAGIPWRVDPNGVTVHQAVYNGMVRMYTGNPPELPEEESPGRLLATIPATPGRTYCAIIWRRGFADELIPSVSWFIHNCEEILKTQPLRKIDLAESQATLEIESKPWKSSLMSEGSLQVGSYQEYESRAALIEAMREIVGDPQLLRPAAEEFLRRRRLHSTT